MKFQIIENHNKIPSRSTSTTYLVIDKWNDFSFVTMFYLCIYDCNGDRHDIGNVKIGFKGQTNNISTHTKLSTTFDCLGSEYFSLGQDLEYYQNIAALSENFKNEILKPLNDIVLNSSYLSNAENEEVFRVSLLRYVSLSVVKGQYERVLTGKPPLTDFEFGYFSPAEEKMAQINLEFTVKANSKPSTNIHALIGRNGVGKTTILNGMIQEITESSEGKAKFIDRSSYENSPIRNDYFSSLVSVSFSAFDHFTQPSEQTDPSKGTCYFYIGLKYIGKKNGHLLKTLTDLHNEFVSALKICRIQSSKRSRLEKALLTLGSDRNFSDMNLSKLLESTDNQIEDIATKLIKKMSSGHAIVLLTITKLVARVEEKTLVLIDEPESHLHPPLLSAFIRSLSELLYDRNGVAIVATHSPVVLQEIPRSCVWKINRSGLSMGFSRLDIESFGENIGILTREVFGLEVVNSGFHQLLFDSVRKGGSYEDILKEYENQLGYEARAILKALVVARDRST